MWLKRVEYSARFHLQVIYIHMVTYRRCFYFMLCYLFLLMYCLLKVVLSISDYM